MQISFQKKFPLDCEIDRKDIKNIFTFFFIHINDSKLCASLCICVWCFIGLINNSYFSQRNKYLRILTWFFSSDVAYILSTTRTAMTISRLCDIFSEIKTVQMLASTERKRTVRTSMANFNKRFQLTRCAGQSVNLQLKYASWHINYLVGNVGLAQNARRRVIEG